ncbi:hypothetical protein E7T09_16225 [Deinococcus sp. KSM4-11]|uniref:hypothetical protein n=1 Tax=Deinococcus sp. KSM4-11 TaxID=2568654 RepID=UPI0010A42727|nr:hypothetical protein [Deinococcus sp. KSM4-11]THF85502.1 hypothetical protein E7T09_16225 [Deinococcus sp. KSM4-11]
MKKHLIAGAALVMSLLLALMGQYSGAATVSTTACRGRPRWCAVIHAVQSLAGNAQAWVSSVTV